MNNFQFQKLVQTCLNWLNAGDVSNTEAIVRHILFDGGAYDMAVVFTSKYAISEPDLNCYASALTVAAWCWSAFNIKSFDH